jgi:arylsulfatase A-like enzyme
MRRLLVALPVVVIVAAAADSFLTRRTVPHRPVEPELYLQALLLWAAFALLALLPAYAILRRLDRRAAKAAAPERAPARAGGTGLRAGFLLLFITLVPVTAHGAIDAFTRPGQNVSDLRTPWPWVTLLVSTAVLGLLLYAVARLLARFPARVVALAAVLLALPIGLFLPRSEAPRAAVHKPEAADKPNLLLLVWDTCRADHTEPYGYGRETTPGLARFAEEALVFESARSATIFTFTSHLTMLTGVMPSEHGARLLRTRYDPQRASTLPALLHAEGYRTGAFVATDVLAGRTGIRHGFEVYRDRVDPLVCDTRGWSLVHDLQAVLALRFAALRDNGRPHWFQDFQRSAPEVLAEAEEWIGRDDPRPWFCMINLYDVHWPYLPAETERDALVREYDGAMDGYLFRSDDYPKGHKPTEEDVAYIRDLYDAELLQLDRDVERFLRGLDLDQTAVLLTADHGEGLGEAGTWMHQHLFEPQLSVPFMLRLPGGERRGRVQGWVSGIDVMPTLLGLADVAPPAGIQGLDLSRETPAEDRRILVEDSDNFDPAVVRLALYRGQWKIVRDGYGENQRYRLYDLSTDSVGEIDVSAQHPEIQAAMAAEMQELWGDLDKRLAGEAVDLGSQADGLRGLGYVGDD